MPPHGWPVCLACFSSPCRSAFTSWQTESPDSSDQSHDFRVRQGKADIGKQTPAQLLSNRTVLRIPRIGHELKDDLDNIPGLLPESYKIADNGVLFVSADRSDWRFPKESEPTDKTQEKEECRYYNLRLLRAFNFVNSTWGEELWNAVKEKIDKFECLFSVVEACTGIASRFTEFRKTIEDADATGDSKEHNDRLVALQQRAHDLLIDALAAFPYTGLLPSALDKAANKAHNKSRRWTWGKQQRLHGGSKSSRISTTQPKLLRVSFFGNEHQPRSTTTGKPDS